MAAKKKASGPPEKVFTAGIVKDETKFDEPFSEAMLEL